ncbi:MAG: hypothetical protein M1840_009137 [Geoglossum simile]|nr:MAG: hypothetical protein M1840_009137 [Geoglossum simile]
MDHLVKSTDYEALHSLYPFGYLVAIARLYANFLISVEVGLEGATKYGRLEEVKETIKACFHRVHVNYQRALHGKEPIQVGLNRVFLGPPGTGKTTVGRLYGQVLADLGLLWSGEVVVRNPSDFIEEYIGWSELNTKRILRSAAGKVLIIDEAYMLYPRRRSEGGSLSDEFRIAVVDTWFQKSKTSRERIDACFTTSTLARRFPLEDAFHFRDFNDDQLAKILDQKLKKQQLKTTDLAKKVALQTLYLARDRPNFGNGGEVENVISRAKAAQQERVSANLPGGFPPEVILEPQDFDASFERLLSGVGDCRELFRDIVGCEEIIAQFEGYRQTVRGMRMYDIDPRPHIPFTLVFKSPPGTGKTTMARKIGQVFYEMGFLASAEVLECSVSDMVGSYIGQTGPKVINLLEQALGKVLFIDGAYRLGGGGEYTDDAVNELVDSITKPRFAHKIIIILAGYREDMDHLMHANRGLASRFPTEVLFRPLPPEQCLTLLQHYLARLSIRMHGSAAEETQCVELFSRLAVTPSWGNGRDVETLAKALIAQLFRACAREGAKSAGLVVGFEELALVMRQSLGRRLGR